MQQPTTGYEQSESCSICFDPLSDRPSTTIDCEHPFHVDCIIRWFRTDHNDCPQCRSLPIREGAVMNVRNMTLRQFARRKNAPRELKVLVSRLKRAEQASRDVRREFSDYKREHQSVLHDYRRLQARMWMARQRIWRLKWELTHYNFLVA